jgi:hypothetical protein
MGQLMPVFGDRTLLDLALPGTHDSLSYDLDLVVAEGGIDDENALAEILHIATELHLVSGAVEEFVRNQSKTQGLTITQQLDAGVRFIDLRVMLTGGDWRSLHFMQSKQTAVVYLKQLRAWMNAHPTEFGMRSCGAARMGLPWCLVLDKCLDVLSSTLH